jgi:hypothetical protein
MGGGPQSQVNPAIEGNPSYTLNNIAGSNTIVLSVNQMPNHTHWNNSRSWRTQSFFYYIQSSGNSGSGGKLLDISNYKYWKCRYSYSQYN